MRRTDATDPPSRRMLLQPASLADTSNAQYRYQTGRPQYGAPSGTISSLNKAI